MTPQDIERRITEFIEDLRQRLTLDEFKAALEVLANKAISELGSHVDEDIYGSGKNP